MRLINVPHELLNNLTLDFRPEADLIESHFLSFYHLFSALGKCTCPLFFSYSRKPPDLTAAILLVRINVCNLNNLPFSSNTGYSTTDIPSFLEKHGCIFWHSYGANSVLAARIINFKP